MGANYSATSEHEPPWQTVWAQHSALISMPLVVLCCIPLPFQMHQRRIFFWQEAHRSSVVDIDGDSRELGSETSVVCPNAGNRRNPLKSGI